MNTKKILQSKRLKKRKEKEKKEREKRNTWQFHIFNSGLTFFKNLKWTCICTAVNHQRHLVDGNVMVSGCSSNSNQIWDLSALPYVNIFFCLQKKHR